MTEEELIENIKEDPSQFSSLFRKYYKMIFGYVFRRVTDFDSTCDIVSETFRKAFLHINTFTYRGISLKVWLYRIATNETNLYFRYRKITDRYMLKFDKPDAQQFNHYVEEDRKSLLDELSKHRQFMEISVKLKELPGRYQEVICLRYFEGKSNKEIGEILNKKEGTVKSLLSRGLDKLRKKCNVS